MSEYLTGDWPFVWASYGLTWLLFTGYAISLILRSASTPPEDS